MDVARRASVGKVRIQHSGMVPSMATVTTTYLVDDLDGNTENVQTIQFSLDRHDWEIDLSAENAARLRDKLAKYIGAAAAVKPVRRHRKQIITTGAVSKEQSAAIRVWARENGYEVSERGRIPANVREAWESAH